MPPSAQARRVLRAGVIPLWRLNQIVEPLGAVIEGPDHPAGKQG